LAGVFAAFVAPPHPMTAPAMDAKSSRESNAFHRRRRAGIPNKSSADIATLPPRVKIRFSGLSTFAKYPVVGVDVAAAAVV
jgi:hypothetical protein